MITQLLTIVKLDEGAELLKKGEVVAFPTETVYGLGGIVFNEEVVNKIFTAKGRPSDNPLIVHIAERKEASLLARDIPDEAEKLMEAFFPGPLTLILPSQSRVPLSVRGGLSTVAIRMPQLPLARELIRLVGTPLVGPSANLSGKPSATTAQHVLNDLNGKIAAVIDGGPCALGIESTVVSLLDKPTILRPGSITGEQLADVLKCSIQSAQKHLEGAPISPGMKYRHYAPRGCVKLFSSEAQFHQYCNIPSSKKRGMYAHFSAHELYHILREADTLGYEEILIYCDETMQNDQALMNRLSKAAEP